MPTNKKSRLFNESEAEIGRHYIENVTNNIKKHAAPKVLYERIFGVPGSRSEIQTLRNRLAPSRSNPTIGAIGLILEHVPEAHSMSVAEFFGIGSNEALSHGSPFASQQSDGADCDD